MPPVRRNNASPAPPAPPPPPARIPLQERTNTLRIAKDTLNSARAEQQENLPEQGILPDSNLINTAVTGLTTNLEDIKTHFTGLGIEMKKITNASNNQLSIRLDGIVDTLDHIITQTIELPLDMDDKINDSQTNLTAAITMLSNKINGLEGIIKSEIRKEFKKEREFTIALHRNTRSIIRNRNLSTSNNFSPMYSLEEGYGFNKKINGPKKPRVIDSMTIPVCRTICRYLLDTVQPPPRAAKPILEQWWRNRVRHVYGYIDDDDQEGGIGVDSDEEEGE